MSDIGTLVVIERGEKGCGSESGSWEGKRGSCRTWERGEVVEVGR